MLDIDFICDGMYNVFVWNCLGIRSCGHHFCIAVSIHNRSPIRLEQIIFSIPTIQ